MRQAEPGLRPDPAQAADLARRRPERDQAWVFGGADFLAAAFFVAAGFAEAVRTRLRRAFFLVCALRRFIFCEFLRSNLPIAGASNAT